MKGVVSSGNASLFTLQFFFIVLKSRVLTKSQSLGQRVRRCGVDNSPQLFSFLTLRYRFRENPLKIGRKLSSSSELL